LVCSERTYLPWEEYGAEVEQWGTHIQL